MVEEIGCIITKNRSGIHGANSSHRDRPSFVGAGGGDRLLDRSGDPALVAAPEHLRSDDFGPALCPAGADE
jgi:hypothetical protein